MKFGIRKPSLKKTYKARTSAQVKRTVKKSINPMYGKKGMGWINDPKKAAYNKVYNKTTVDAFKEPRKKLPSIDMVGVFTWVILAFIGLVMGIVIGIMF